MSGNGDDRWFVHGGDLGDMIYGLHVIREMGGGHLRYAYDRLAHNRYGIQTFANIAPLVNAQPCVKTFEMNSLAPASAIDLRFFRGHFFRAARARGYRQRMVDGLNLVQLHRFAAGIGWKTGAFDVPWLVCLGRDRVDERRVIFSKTARYPNERFDWRAVVRKYGAQAAFLGSVNEWINFRNLHNIDIPFAAASHLMEAARFINGCDLFVGNQSALLAIAQGLGKRCVVECWYRFPDCVFPGENRFVDCIEQMPALPDL